MRSGIAWVLAPLFAALAFAQDDAPAEAPPADLMTIAEGAVLLSASSNLPGAIGLIDGSGKIGWHNALPRHALPYQFVFELRAPTGIKSIGVSNAGQRPGGVLGAAAKAIVVEGSAEGPDAGFVPLVGFDAAEDGETIVDIRPAPPVRWLRVSITSNYGAAQWTYLQEVMVYGAQDAVDSTDRFNGVFAIGRTGLVELRQSGMSVTGCYQEDGGGHGHGEIWGDVADGVARVSWRSEIGVLGSALLTIDSQGRLGGVRFRDKSRTIWAGPPAPDGTTTSCSTEPAPANPIADALAEDGSVRLYGILFDFDQDTLKPASETALRQLLAVLEADAALRLEISGHTDSDGEDAYNLDLSQRRAAAVVAWLVAAGIDAARLEPKGEGETRPVASNDTADGRALNRRVEARKL